ncbi:MULTISPECIES: LexA family protein [Shewanella]|mgnify:FL=1|jgi:repressor LexA|uniref:LexA family protein n=2 Tax=Shewanellaceae TaxID=267890 RepID=UPI001CBC02E8|nr:MULTISPECIES: MarR family transcriptional regulator [Shewanella]UJF21674.1 MarR family transcriptional regulator [Shewanella sp. OMA3-2]UJF22910.1 MarR family transcriptional regulator [Shewanella sp. OMA3-2]
MSIPTEKKINSAFSVKQGQYLAFIYYYSKVNGYPPAQADIQKYFGVSAPTVHQTILKLETDKLISRTPRESRSLKVLIKTDELPLEW